MYANTIVGWHVAIYWECVCVCAHTVKIEACRASEETNSFCLCVFGGIIYIGWATYYVDILDRRNREIGLLFLEL